MNKLDFVIIRILGAIIGATAFLTIGYYVPFLYTRYIDNTEYLYIEPNPLTIDNKNVKACDNVIYRGKRYSKTDFIGEVLTDLVKQESGDNVKITAFEMPLRSTTVDKGAINLEFSYKIPCEAQPGQYYLSSLITYKINNVEKTYRWTSEIFIVN